MTTSPWIETWSGKQFHFLAPQEDEVDIHDVARALSRICRYAGHTKRWYSVAEHCCLLADYVYNKPGHNARDALTILHHDDPEFILGDLAGPIKKEIPGYKFVEKKTAVVLAGKWGTEYPLPAWVKVYDRRMLKDERTHVLKPSGHPWFSDQYEPLKVKPWNWLGRWQWYVRKQWLKRHFKYTRIMLAEQAS